MSRNERQEFERLSLPLMNKLFRIALMMTKTRAEAEDLLQEAYLKAFRFFHRFRKGSDFQAWIHRILVNAYINEYRKKKRDSIKNTKFRETLSKTEYGAGNDIQRNIEMKTEVDYYEIFDDKIVTALDKLPEKYRIVVLLSDVSQLKYKEIASVLGCPIGTVMSRLNRGRKILSNYLRKYAASNNFITADDSNGHACLCH